MKKKVLAAILCWASLATGAGAVDTVWKTVVLDGTLFDVHVVSSVSLGNGFPNRDLRYALDAGWITDLYVVNQTTGSATSLNEARNLVSLLQTSFKYPADPADTLSPNEGIDPVDITDISVGHPLWTSFYFSNFFVNTFLTGGAVGLDNQNHRADIYEEVFFDMALQPDLVDRPGDVQRFQTLLDRATDEQQITNALGAGVTAFQLGSAASTIPWSDYKAALAEIKTRINRFVDLSAPPGPDPPLERLSGVLDGVGSVQAISGAAARVLLLEALALEVGGLRMRVLSDYVDRVAATGSIDPAMLQGLVQTQARIDDLTDDYFFKLPVLIAGAIGEDVNDVLHLDKLTKYIIQQWFGKEAATTFGKVALPWILSYKTYQGIRRQQDRAQVASLAATLHKLLFDSPGLAHHRSLIHSGGTVDAEELQAFAELYQMSWYLSARHYQDTLNTLNNKLSWIWGVGIDIFTPGGSPYSDQMDILRNDLNYRRMATLRITSPSYLATVSDFRTSSPQDGEFTWLMQMVRDFAVTVPNAPPAKLLDLCITLPFDPAGTPATLEGMNIRYEPRSCSDPTGSMAWECGANDPDGECTARVQLFWDDDTDSANADCDNDSGPCPINGAEDLNPQRLVFFWNPANDGLGRDDYYIFARISDDDDVSDTYSSGFYRFIDPIKEGDHWSVDDVDVTEGSRSDGDGIPEIGEEIDVLLSMENLTGRTLSGVKIDDLRLQGDPVRHLTQEDWDEANASDREMTHVFDDTVLAPNASAGQIVTATDDFNTWIGENSDTSVGFIASITYDDPSNPTRPDLRRIQEVDFEAVVSDGTDNPQFRCASTRLVDDTDVDGVFESGEKGYFKAELCNDGTWQAHDVRLTFVDPPPLGEWVDEDSPYPPLDPGACLEGTDTFVLRMATTECGSLTLPFEVEYNGGQTQGPLDCSIDVVCAPYQSIQDEKEAGTVTVGDTLMTSVNIYSTGAATLVISGVAEKNGAADTTVTAFPPTLAPGASDVIQVSIDTTGMAPGTYQRTIEVTSNANNTDEGESIIFFGVSAGGTAQQLTFSGIVSDPADIDGQLAVFSRSNDIYAVNVHTLVETRITDNALDEYGPRISGDRVVFNRRDPATGTFNVFLYDLATSTETQITNLAVSQADPDIRGDLIVWEDRRGGSENVDLYSYQIPGGSMNGSLFVDLGAGFSARNPRIEDDYIAYERNRHLPDNFFRRDFGYKDRSTGTVYALGLDVDSPLCSASNLFDIYDHHLAFECDCGSSCDNDDQIYYVNMDTHSTPIRLTCDAGFEDDREEPAILGSDVLYKRDGDDDIYQVALGAGACPTEVPLQVGASQKTRPAADPRTGAYVFNDSQSGAVELWGVIPPPPIEAGVSGFDLDPAEYLQEGSYPYHVEVTNYGTQALTNVGVKVTDDGTTIFQGTIANLAVGASTTLDDSWDTSGSATGPHELVAMLDPAPAGDADPANDSRTLTPTVVDDDEAPPVISAAMAAPAASSDGDPYIEEGEEIDISWNASDPAGIGSTHASLLGADYPGVEGAPGEYTATVPSPGTGSHQVTISATDGDDSPETTTPPVDLPLVVYPAFPQVVATVPADGATGVDPRAAVDVTFSVDMDPGSIDGQTVGLADPGAQSVPAVVTYDAATMTATVQPLASLSPLTEYTATVASGAMGVRDIRQNPLPADEVWSFETGEAVGACGTLDTRTVANDTLTGVHVIEACETITLGPNLEVQGTATFRAPTVILVGGVTFADGASVTIVNEIPTP